MPPARSAAAVVRQIRLWTGLVLFTYLTTHFLNHALGLVSLEAMAAGQGWFVLIWRSLPGTVALYGSFGIHNLLALWALYRRRTLRMPAWEASQLALGLLVPPLLVWHVVGTRLAHEVAGTQTTYTFVVLALWQLNPIAGLRQVVVLAVAWIHGCIGLHFWLRLRPWYPRVARTIYSGFLLLPVLALLGFATAGQEVARRAREPGFVQTVIREARLPSPAQRAVLERVAYAIFWGDLGAIALVLAARAVREQHSPASGRACRVSGRPRGARARRVHDPRGEPVRGDPARLGLRRARPLLDVPRARDPWRGAPARRPPRTSCACSGAWGRPPTCAWPARCGPGAISRWCRSCPRGRARPRRSRPGIATARS